MKLLSLIAGLAAFPYVALCGVIDVTNFETFLSTYKEAKKGQSAEDCAIVEKIVCEAGHGLHLKKPEDKEVVLTRLRPLLHGKSIQAVVMEVKKQQASEKAEKERKAEELDRKGGELVRERRELWLGRGAKIQSLVPGVTREEVLKLLGEPDRKADSPPYENWLYRCDAAHNEERIWIDVKVIQLINGTVSKVTPLTEQKAIENMKPLKETAAKEAAPSEEKSLAPQK